VSTFSDLSALAAESHDEFLADDYEYRQSRDESFVAIRARRYNERIENRRNATGWNRVNLVDFSFAKTEVENPVLHAVIRTAEGSPEYTITEIKSITSGRWVVTCQLTRVGEISRPGLRRN
jgi:hypothetical protein